METVILDARTVTGAPADMGWEEIEALGHLTVYQHTDKSETIGRICNAEAVLTNKVVIDRQVMDNCPRLRYIGILATGCNVVDLDEAHRRGIVVTNIPGYSTMSVAQHTFALLLEASNSVAHYAEANACGAWCRSEDFCYWDKALTELSGRRFGIVGMGNIGCAVARIALAFGMEVVAATKRTDLPEGVAKLPLDALLQSCDVVSLHCPLTDANKGFINACSIAKMKPGAILINTGRGPLVVEEDVAKALHSGHLGAYLADVLCHEPALPDNPLLTAPRCRLTPHIAWASRESRLRLIKIAAANLRAFGQGQPQNVV